MRIWAGRNNFLRVKKYVKECHVEFFRTEFMPKSSIEGGGLHSFFAVQINQKQTKKRKVKYLKRVKFEGNNLEHLFRFVAGNGIQLRILDLPLVVKKKCRCLLIEKGRFKRTPNNKKKRAVPPLRLISDCRKGEGGFYEV